MHRQRIEGVEALLVVGSGKGGVGKSTVSVNLAVGLAKRGARVGLFDGDAYGPSVPMMLGVRKGGMGGAEANLPLAQRGKLAPERMLQPLLRYGARVMSVGFFIGEEQAVALMPDVPGMLMRQLLYTVNWGTLDYLIIDLPPGNGEPQATLCREMQIDGAILVTTPQDIARIDTAKALAMFQGARVPVLGVVHNMDGFICPHCGARVDIFPASREARTVLDALPLLASIPLDPITGTSSDKGQPVLISAPQSSAALALHTMVEQVAASIEAWQCDEREVAEEQWSPEETEEHAGRPGKGEGDGNEGED
ncbi:MAG TPA: P-loop NTPase [Ktedonobacteraceae bacterium]|nr:P-loop NTPase [Ktedonobacteraceae bacterium]